MQWKITLGYCGATDCCLILHHPDGRWKEYSVESAAWKILSMFYMRDATESLIAPRFAEIIWDDMDKDLLGAS